jgi:hypothetical protein
MAHLQASEFLDCRMAEIGARESYRGLAFRAPIHQHAMVSKTHGVHGQAPSLPEIARCVLGKALRAIHQAMTLPGSVVKLEVQHPPQHAAEDEAGVQNPVIHAQRRLLGRNHRGAGSLTQRFDQPSRAQPINVAIPNLPLIPEFKMTKSLNLQAQTMGQPDQP